MENTFFVLGTNIELCPGHVEVRVSINETLSLHDLQIRKSTNNENSLTWLTKVHYNRNNIHF